MASNSTLFKWLLRVLPGLYKGGPLLVQMDKGNTLNSFIFLKRNYFESIRSPVIDQLKLLTSITTTISLQVASSGCQNASQPYITCATTLKIVFIPICYQGRFLSLPLLGIIIFLSSLYTVTIQKTEKFCFKV